MKDLESFLINQRSDFEYGYKTNNALIMMVYQISAMALMDLALVNFVNLANNMSSTKNGIVKPTRNYKKISFRYHSALEEGRLEQDCKGL